MNPLQHLCLALLGGYRLFLSPVKAVLFGPASSCRFTPSCSAYAQMAIRCHGAVRGGLLSAQRLCRCHPWGEAGHDPVPPILPT